MRYLRLLTLSSIQECIDDPYRNYYAFLIDYDLEANLQIAWNENDQSFVMVNIIMYSLSSAAYFFELMLSAWLLDAIFFPRISRFPRTIPTKRA